MGLDIHIGTNNIEEIYTPEYHGDKNGYFQKHSLSRTFCNFICRRNVISHEPELEQIGRITGVDISAIYEMENYPDEEGVAFFMGVADNEEEKKKILEKAKEDRGRLNGNIDRVLTTVTELIKKLNTIDNLPSLLLPTDVDSLWHEEYFSAFQVDKGDGYIGNNFGQDLRNFKRFLEFAKGKGTTTVWFHYG